MNLASAFAGAALCVGVVALSSCKGKGTSGTGPAPPAEPTRPAQLDAVSPREPGIGRFEELLTGKANGLASAELDRARLKRRDKRYELVLKGPPREPEPTRALAMKVIRTRLTDPESPLPLRLLKVAMPSDPYASTSKSDLRFFEGPRLEERTAEEAVALPHLPDRIETRSGVDYDKVRLTLYVDVSSLAPAQRLAVFAYDTQTGWPLHRAGSSLLPGDIDGETLTLGVHAPRSYQREITLVLDVAAGEPDTVALEERLRSPTDLGGGVMGFYLGRAEGSSAGGRPVFKDGHYSLEYGSFNNQGRYTTLFLGHSQPGGMRSLRIEALDADGQVLESRIPTGPFYVNEQVHSPIFKHGPDNPPASFRITRFPEYRRYVIDLGNLLDRAGLPEPAANLLEHEFRDVWIYSRGGGGAGIYSWKSRLESFLQISLPEKRPPAPRGKFDYRWKTVTGAELLDQYLGFYPEGTVIAWDKETNGLLLR